MTNLWVIAKRAFSVPPDERSPLAVPTILGVFLLIAYVAVGSPEQSPEVAAAPLIAAIVFLGMLLTELLGVCSLCNHLRQDAPDGGRSERVNRLARRITTIAISVPLMAALTMWIQVVDLERRVQVLLLGVLLIVIVYSVGRIIPLPQPGP